LLLEGELEAGRVVAALCARSSDRGKCWVESLERHGLLNPGLKLPLDFDCCPLPLHLPHYRGQQFSEEVTS
jgi:hypothetical protein